MTALNLPAAGDAQTGSVYLGVIDSGIQRNHSDLAQGRSAKVRAPHHGHGTEVPAIDSAVYRNSRRTGKLCVPDESSAAKRHGGRNSHGKIPAGGGHTTFIFTAQTDQTFYAGQGLFNPVKLSYAYL